MPPVEPILKIGDGVVVVVFILSGLVLVSLDSYSCNGPLSLVLIEFFCPSDRLWLLLVLHYYVYGTTNNQRLASVPTLDRPRLMQ